jgi:anti-sigma-K factor RskA
MSHTDETDVHKHVTMEKARAGETTGRVRIILAVSSIVAIVALLLVVFFFAQPGAQPPTGQ